MSKKITYKQDIPAPGDILEFEYKGHGTCVDRVSSIAIHDSGKVHVYFECFGEHSFNEDFIFLNEVIRVVEKGKHKRWSDLKKDLPYKIGDVVSYDFDGDCTGVIKDIWWIFSDSPLTWRCDIDDRYVFDEDVEGLVKS